MGSQSVLYFYRISAYIFTIGLVVLIAYIMERANGNWINVLSLVLVMLFSFCILSYFVDLHPNAAEGLQISYLMEEMLSQGKELGGDRHGFKREARTMGKAYEDGKFC